MTDPYDTLGVPRDATPDQIKKAHRKAVKEHHPDKGGNPETFNAVQRSYALLSDEERRQHYDKTGETQDDVLKRKQNELMETCARIVQEVIESAVDMNTTDIAKMIRQKLKANGMQVRDAILQNDKRLERVRTMMKRLKKNKKASPNSGVVGEVTKRIEGEVIAHGHKLKQALDLHVRVEAIFEAYDYEFEPPPRDPYDDQRRSAWGGWDIAAPRRF